MSLHSLDTHMFGGWDARMRNEGKWQPLPVRETQKLGETFCCALSCELPKLVGLDIFTFEIGSNWATWKMRIKQHRHVAMYFKIWSHALRWFRHPFWSWWPAAPLTPCLHGDHASLWRLLLIVCSEATIMHGSSWIFSCCRWNPQLPCSTATLVLRKFGNAAEIFGFYYTTVPESWHPFLIPSWSFFFTPKQQW